MKIEDGGGNGSLTGSSKNDHREDYDYQQPDDGSNWDWL